ACKELWDRYGAKIEISIHIHQTGISTYHLNNISIPEQTAIFVPTVAGGLLPVSLVTIHERTPARQ
ncbi:MAG: hypothetical protein R3252_13575, partial [Robiginitalea sp.]|nr:hypothetical protein [Robiginitalea sp.]